MTLEESKRMAQSIWESIKPLLIFLLVVISLISLALSIIVLVNFYDKKDITLLVLVITDFSVLGIFVIGFIIVGLRYVFALIIKKEEVKCIYCGKIMQSKSKSCSNCGNENHAI
jgi:hypothetical protein